MNYFDTGYFRENDLLSETELQTIFTDYQITSVPMIIVLRKGQLYDSFRPNFNEERDNTIEIRENIKLFIEQYN